MATPQSPSRPDSSRQARRRPSALFAVFLIVPALIAGCATVEPFSGESVDLAVEHMLHAVGEAARMSRDQAGDAIDLELSQVSVTLKTTAERTSSNEFTLWVVTFDGSREHDFTQTVTVSLKPPEKGTKVSTGDATDSPHPEMVRELKKGFDAAYLTARGARDGVRRSHSGDTPLTTSTISVTLNVTITGSASATPTITILGIDLTGSHTQARQNVHQITMVFKEKTSDDASADKSS